MSVTMLATVAVYPAIVYVDCILSDGYIRTGNAMGTLLCGAIAFALIQAWSWVNTHWIIPDIFKPATRRLRADLYD